MGLLSDPSLTPRNKLGRTLARHHGKICLLFYVASIVWFGCLGHNDFNHGTYLSENALSPGLVYPVIRQDSTRLAQSLLDELRREREVHKKDTPHAWIFSKLQQIGLEAYVHNYTLNYPFAGGNEFHGKNVYGILRAPRSSSTEGIVFAAPYRPPSSVHTDIVASVPTLLAFAEFARRKNVWSKDLIFLITEQEQLGMHAFLKAYFNNEALEKQASSFLQYGSLPARAGALQAALNLEIQDLDIDYIDVKIEGLNGQLPNLDMFNLVQRITSRESISSGYKQSALKKRHSPHTSIEGNLLNMLTMLLSQSTGVPTGNHGLFHRYRIESLTLEGVKRQTNRSGSSRSNASALPLLKIIEGISRSLNNLLERFHQSYFFYILVQNDRFVSIGDYMPCLALLTVPLFLKAFLLWLMANGSVSSVEGEEGDGSTDASGQQDTQLKLPYGTVLSFFGVVASLGWLCHVVPRNETIVNHLAGFGLGTAQSITLLLMTIVLLGFILPFVFNLEAGGLDLLHLGALVALGVTLIVVGLLNFALAFLVAIFVVPLAISISTSTADGSRKTLSVVYSLLLNPLVVVYSLIFVSTLFQFAELAMVDVAIRALNASMDAITFALVDYMIYNNWLYTAGTVVFFPLWCVFWTLALSRNNAQHIDLEKKRN